MVLSSGKLQDEMLQEELQQRTLKIERLFRHGLQHSSSVIVPEEKSGEFSVSSSSDPLEIEAEAREAENVFRETLSHVMEQKQLPQYLFQLLQQRQSETSAILRHYDDIISMMKKDMNDQDKEYRNRIEKQSDVRELLQARAEDFVSELMRVGNEEIAAAREAIISHTEKSSKEIYAKTRQFLDDTSADQPFDPHSWKAPSDMLTFDNLKNIFIRSQEDISQMRDKSLSEICDRRKNLEKEKLDYALERENLDRNLFDMSRGYRSDMLALVAAKREITKSADRKRSLARELGRLQQDIGKVEELRESSPSSAQKRNGLERTEKTDVNKWSSKESRVLEMKRSEVNEVVDETLNMYRWFWERTCGRSLQPAGLAVVDTKEERKQTEPMSELGGVLSLVPHNTMLNELLNWMEQYRRLVLNRRELSSLKQGLCQENSELQVSLKCYHTYNNSS